MLPAQTAHHHRQCSACAHASLSRPTSAVMDARCWSGWPDLCFVLSDKLLGGSMHNPINRDSELRALLEELNLDGMAALFTDLALKAAKENLSHEAYLFELAKQEKEQRVARRTARLLRQSGLPL